MSDFHIQGLPDTGMSDHTADQLDILRWLDNVRQLPPTEAHFVCPNCDGKITIKEHRTFGICSICSGAD